MVVDVEMALRRDGVLALFDATVDELLDLAAVQANDVVMVVAAVQFEHGHAVLEMVARHQAGGLELRQHPVDGRQPDVFV